MIDPFKRLEKINGVFIGASRRLYLVISDITCVVMARIGILSSVGRSNTNLKLIWNWHISDNALQPQLQTWVSFIALYLDRLSDLDILLLWRAWAFTFFIPGYSRSFCTVLWEINTLTNYPKIYIYIAAGSMICKILANR